MDPAKPLGFRHFRHLTVLNALFLRNFLDDAGSDSERAVNLFEQFLKLRRVLTLFCVREKDHGSETRDKGLSRSKPADAACWFWRNEDGGLQLFKLCCHQTQQVAQGSRLCPWPDCTACAGLLSLKPTRPCLIFVAGVRSNTVRHSHSLASSQTPLLAPHPSLPHSLPPFRHTPFSAGEALLSSMPKIQPKRQLISQLQDFNYNSRASAADLLPVVTQAK